MLQFKQWIQIREMSASGRRKAQAALGLAPPVADIFSRSTPPPWQVEKLTKALKKSKKKKKGKSKCDADAPFPGDSVVEAKKSQPIVHKDIDAFIKSVEGLAKDVWELDLLKKKKAVLDKMDQTAKKNIGTKKPVKEPEKDKPEDKTEDKPEEKELEKKVSEKEPNVRKLVPKSEPKVATRKKPLGPKPKLGEEKQD